MKLLPFASLITIVTLSPFLTTGKVGWKLEVDFNETEVVAALNVEALIGPVTCDDGATANESVLVVIPAFDEEGVGLGAALGVALGDGLCVGLGAALGVTEGFVRGIAVAEGVGEAATLGVGPGTNPPLPPLPPPLLPLPPLPPDETRAVMENDRATGVAAAYEELPFCEAVTVQVPSEVKLTVEPVTVQFPEAAKVTVNPDVLEAVTVSGPGSG